MVKISIKKEEKTIKPRQRQKQKQSQKVIVNIGNSYKPKRRRTGKALERNKAVNKQSTTPTQINVPQSMPIYKQPESQNTMNEILKYIKDSEQQKEIIKKQEKKNELEKDKKADIKKTALEDAQTQFSKVDSQSISSLTSGTATPNPLSFPINPKSLFESLMKVADLQGENPNSGRVSFSTLQSNPLSSANSSVDPFSVIGTNNSSSRSIQSTNSSSIMTVPTYNSSERTYDIASSVSSNSRQSNPLSESSNTSAIPDAVPQPDDYLGETQGEALPIDPPIQDEEEAQPAEVNDQQLVVFEPEPEQKLVVYTQPERVNTSATATEQLIGTDNSSKAPFTRPINKPLPIINLKDVISEVAGLRGTKSDIREARLKFLEPERPQQTIKQSIDDEPVDIPKFTDEELKAYKDKTKETRKAESTTPEPDTEKPELTAFKTKIKNSTNKELGNMLIKNNIKEPTTGNNYYIDTLNRVKVRGGRRVFDKTYLAGQLLKAFNDGLIN